MTTIRAALAWSFVERYAMIVLGLFSYVLVARLLTPAEIGLYSVTAALIGVAQVIRDFGVGNYLIQERELSDERLDTAYGFALLSGVVMFALVNACAPAIVHFYRDPGMAPVLRATSINFIALPFCSIALAMLRRLMRFDRLMVANLLGTVVGFVTTIGLAIAKFGPASLAWGAVACNVVTALCAWFALPATSRPRRPRLVEWRAVANYGRQSTFAGVVVAIAADMNDLVVGKVLGFAPVAMLSRGMGTMYLFQRDVLGAARNVAFPAFAAAHRDGKPLEPMFVYTFACVTAIGWSFYGFLMLFPLESMRLLAGPQWDAAAPYVLLFAIAGTVLCLAPLTQTVILATGRVDLASRADIITSVLRLALVALAAVWFRDLKAVALALCTSLVVSVPIFLAFKHRAVPSDWPALAAQACRGLAVALGTLFMPLLLSMHAGFSRVEPLPTSSFLLIAALTAATWLLMLRLCKHPMARDPIYLGAVSRVSMRLGILGKR